MIAFERVVDAFRDAGLVVNEKGSGRASAQAPGHSPGDRSVTLTAIEGQTLVHSHSDQTDEVLEALGLTYGDLFDAGRIDYTYPDGRVKHRNTQKKDFRQSGNTKGTSLYRADKLADADTVYVCEGEKDVHAAEALGVVATCTPSTSGIKNFDLTPLYGKNVIVVQDRDDKGRSHAQMLATLLDGHSETVIVEAKTGNDLADHVAAGYGLEELTPVHREEVEAEEYRRPRVWAATQLKGAASITWLAARRLPAGAVTYMIGPEGIGKSLWLVWLVSLITTGKAFPAFGIPARKPQVVVLVLTEDDWATVARPRLEVAGADLEYVRVICAEQDGSGSPTFPNDMDVVTEAAEGAAVVIVDAWADTLPGSLSVKDPQHARRALHPWKELATRSGAAILLSGHTNREKGGNVRNAYGLTGELRKKARMTLLAQPDGDDERVMLIGPEKSNLTGPVPASKFQIESVQVFDPTEDSDGTVPRLVWIGDAEQSAGEVFADAAEQGEGSDDRNDVDEWLLSFLVSSQKATEVYSAADANGFSKDQTKRSKKRLGVVAERPQNPGPWFWSMPATKQGAGSTEYPLSNSVLPALPVLPVRSDGVQQGAESTGSREQEIPVPHAPCGPSRIATECTACRQPLNPRNITGVCAECKLIARGAVIGGVTENTPGNTPRVQAILDRVASAAS